MQFRPGQVVTFEFNGRMCRGIVDENQRISGFVIVKAEETSMAVRETSLTREAS